jgi:hypothetical protein
MDTELPLFNPDMTNRKDVVVLFVSRHETISKLVVLPLVVNTIDVEKGHLELVCLVCKIHKNNVGVLLEQLDTLGCIKNR